RDARITQSCAFHRGRFDHAGSDGRDRVHIANSTRQAGYGRGGHLQERTQNSREGGCGMSTLKRWFDLSRNGAKLDRELSETGSAYLSLEFASMDKFSLHIRENTAEMIADMGWV